MTLYIKAGPDGTSTGDCPFAHYVRMVLHEKNLEYDLKPTTQETKPTWLIQHYEGKMPALRHRKECYTESEVIAQYLDFFFPEPALAPTTDKGVSNEANQVVDGIFPAVARYLKHVPDGDDKDAELKTGLEAALQALESHLSSPSRLGPFLVGDGQVLTLVDCSLAPKLYHMKTGLKAFKDNAIKIEAEYPHVSKYMETIFERQSFIDSLYPEETVVWGWSNARK
jgi:glutathione S-transferase